MSITQTEQNKSIEFMQKLKNLMDFVEDMLPFINEQQYLNVCNDLKSLHNLQHFGDAPEPIVVFQEIVSEIRRNEVFRVHEQRLYLKVKDKQTQLTDAEKLKKGWKSCSKCDRLVLNLTEHQYTDVCKRAHESKKLSLNSKQLDTTNLSVFIHRLRAWAIKWGKRKFYAGK